jgi:glycosyltransferase involved in cell wall biosynthesis
VAVIATQTGGIPELLHHEENGLLVPPGNGQAIGDAIRKLVEDDSLRRRLAYHGYEKARKELSMTRMMELTLESYRKAMFSAGHGIGSSG